MEPFWIEVTRHRVTAPISIKAPLKIAHVSDLHVVTMGRREQALLRRLEEERPDVIAITGDSVAEGDRDAGTSTFADEDYVPVGEVLRRLRAPEGVFAVRGNWENWRRLRQERAFYEEAGVRLLVNEAARIRDDVWVFGLDESWNGTPDLEKAVADMPRGVFRIALFHSPAGFDSVAGHASLALAGHTHGGQVRLPLLPPLWLPPSSGSFVAGWYERAGTRLYVSRGLGMSILPARFFCRPELAIHTLAP